MATHHEGVVLATLGFLGVAVDDSRDLLVEDAVVDVGLLGVEVFVEGGPDHAVRVDGHSKLLGDVVEVGIVPEWFVGYLRSPPSWERAKRLPPFSTYFLRSSISDGEKASWGAANTSRWAFLIFS